MRYWKIIEYGFIKIFVYLIWGVYWKCILIKIIFYMLEIVWLIIKNVKMMYIILIFIFKFIFCKIK